MKLDVLVLVALVALQSALLTFYWSHCAGPALVHAGARPRTFRVVQTVGVLSLVGFVIAIAILAAARTVNSLTTREQCFANAANRRR